MTLWYVFLNIYYHNQYFIIDIIILIKYYYWWYYYCCLYYYYYYYYYYMGLIIGESFINYVTFIVITIVFFVVCFSQETYVSLIDDSITPTNKYSSNYTLIIYVLVNNYTGNLLHSMYNSNFINIQYFKIYVINEWSLIT